MSLLKMLTEDKTREEVEREACEESLKRSGISKQYPLVPSRKIAEEIFDLLVRQLNVDEYERQEFVHAVENGCISHPFKGRWDCKFWNASCRWYLTQDDEEEIPGRDEVFRETDIMLADLRLKKLVEFSKNRNGQT